VNVSATSAEDGTKSSFVSVIVAGAVGSVSQIVSAAAGGTITLPDGSSVTIPANVLTADQNITLSELSAPAQPPNQLMVGLGSTLLVTFSNPIQPAVRPAQPRRGSTIGQSSPNDQTSPSLTFTISESTAPSGLNGSEGLASIADTANNTFFGPVTYSAQGQTAQLSVPYSALTGLENPVSSVAVAPVNTVYQAYPTNLPPAVALPAELCWQPSSSTWNDFTANCSSEVSGQKVLVVVHGMMSCVEQLGTLASYMQTTFAPNPVEYDLVVGFDYDWTQSLTGNGNLLAAFLEQLSSASKIDIIAHSEGVPVSLYGASQASDHGLIRNFIGLAGPILGTPIAGDQAVEQEIFDNYTATICPASDTFQKTPFATLVQSPFVGDLQENSAALKTIIQAAVGNLSNTTILLAGGNSEGLLFFYYLWPGHTDPFGTTPNDGIVGLDSALAFNSGLVVHPLPPFPLFHTDLPGDTSTNGVLWDVRSQVNASLVGTPFPQLLCSSSESPCQGQLNTLFTFAGTGFGSNAADIQIFSQNSTGVVTQMSESTLLDDGGDINWTEFPTNSSPTGTFSVFAFDTLESLASNNVMQTVQPGTTTPAIAFNPTSLNFGSLQTGTSATQSVTLTNTGTATLQITQVELINNASGFSLNNPCPTSLTVGASCAPSVTFSPTQAGAQSATLSVTDNASGSPQGVPLSGTGTSSAQAPTVTTGSASAVTSNSATLGGTVNPNGSDTFVWFQYSTNSSMSGATSTGQQDIGAGTTTVPFSANLFFLTGGTTYYYQAMASNSAGTSKGSILSFTTLSSVQAPTVTTGSASAVTSNGATLNGAANSNGSDTFVWFQYATNSSMNGATATLEADIGAGTTTVSFFATLTGLAPNTTFYYQAVADNIVGLSLGAVLSFTTAP
jgi:triacylglycerol esterase/lipase EstA (alpha/beta hydrolase family)